ncbi:MAG: sulfurtransferase TusA family protein [Dermatophilaceae bacterium]
MSSVEVDARGLRCPLPVIRLAAAARDAPVGTGIIVLASDPAARHDIPAWCRMRGHELREMTQVSDPAYLRFVVVVRPQPSKAAGAGSGSARPSRAM